MKTIFLNKVYGYYDIRNVVRYELSNIISSFEKHEKNYPFYDYNEITYKKTLFIDTIFMNEYTYKEYFKDVFQATTLCGVNLYLRESVENFHIQLWFKGKIIETVKIKDSRKLSFKEFFKNSF